MMSQSLTERYNDRIAGVLSCYDRMVITGTLPGVCYAEGMTRYLNPCLAPTKINLALSVSYGLFSVRKALQPRHIGFRW
jgi:hypothetical protein